MNENSSAIHVPFISNGYKRDMLVRSPTHIALLALLAVTTAAAEKPLTIDFAQSRVEIGVKATLDSFTGRLARYEPVVLIDDDGRIASARLTFQFRDVMTGKASRDEAMHKWQQTATFPAGEFTLASLEPAANGAYTAFGRLTFHGATRELRFPVSVTRHGPVYAVDGDAIVDTREHGLPIIRMMGILKVDPLVHVRFHLQGSLHPLTASNQRAP